MILFSMYSFLIQLLIFLTITIVAAQQQSVWDTTTISGVNNDTNITTSYLDTYSYYNLPICNGTSLEIRNSPNDMEPCIIANINPSPFQPSFFRDIIIRTNDTTDTDTDTTTDTNNDDNNNNNNNNDTDTTTTSTIPTQKSYLTIVPVVMVTSSTCNNHRDGSYVAFDKLNQPQPVVTQEQIERLQRRRRKRRKRRRRMLLTTTTNTTTDDFSNSSSPLDTDTGLGGIPIGYYQDHYIQFHFVSVVAGNYDVLGKELYDIRHQQVLESLLVSLKPLYIVGTCSQIAYNEKQLAGQYETILMAAVGPPSFYTTTPGSSSSSSNPWVFGIHINSDDYTLDTVRRLTFFATENEKKNEQQQQQQYEKNEYLEVVKNLPTAVATTTTTTSPISSTSTSTTSGGGIMNFQQKVVVIYRTTSEFFYSTCRATIVALKKAGFTNIHEILYDPSADHDFDNITNQYDTDFLRHVIADQACPAKVTTTTTNTNSNTSFHDDDANHRSTKDLHPALFICTLDEHPIILERLNENQCLPTSIWLAASTWTWAAENNQTVPYMFGGSQWQPALQGSDKYFPSGAALLEYLRTLFQYPVSYDAVVNYAMGTLFAQHLQWSYRIVDVPNVSTDLLPNTESRELLRRQLLSYQGETIFGPIAFDSNQRNIGRSSVSSQWLPFTTVTKQVNNVLTNDDTTTENNNNTSIESSIPMNMTDNGLFSTTTEYRITLVSPITYAEAAAVLPAPSFLLCPPGQYINEDFFLGQQQQQDDNNNDIEAIDDDSTNKTPFRALLTSKCAYCPINTYTSVANQVTTCTACPAGSHTTVATSDNTNVDGTGATYCVRYDDNLLEKGTYSFGYLMMSISWILALSFITWIIRHKHDPVVRLAQYEFLLLICVGTLLSTATVVPISFQAGTNDDTSSATRACQVAPFLYVIGWVFQYGSLSSKTYRLFRLMVQPTVVPPTPSSTENPSSEGYQPKRRTVKNDIWTKIKSSWIVSVAFVIDVTLVSIWTVISPLEYVRTYTQKDLTDNVLTIQSVGRCELQQSTSSSTRNTVYTLIGLIGAHHLSLMFITNYLLYRVRNVHHRYQEQTYLALASLSVVEIVVIGVPVLIAAQDSVSATYIVLCSFICIADIAVLGFTFIPKITYQMKGLDHGVTVTESIMKDSHKHAKNREMMRSNVTTAAIAAASPQPSLQKQKYSTKPAMQTTAKTAVVASPPPPLPKLKERPESSLVHIEISMCESMQEDIDLEQYMDDSENDQLELKSVFKPTVVPFNLGKDSWMDGSLVEEFVRPSSYYPATTPLDEADENGQTQTKDIYTVNDWNKNASFNAYASPVPTDTTSSRNDSWCELTTSVFELPTLSLDTSPPPPPILETIEEEDLVPIDKGFNGDEVECSESQTILPKNHSVQQQQQRPPVKSSLKQMKSRVEELKMKRNDSFRNIVAKKKAGQK